MEPMTADPGLESGWILIENGPEAGSGPHAVSGGWTVLADPGFELGDAGDELRQRSVGTRVVRLLVIEREGFSHATAWVDGEVAWEISYEAELDERPLVSDGFPSEVPTDRADFFPAAIMAVQSMTGWRPPT
jgi:hypothetical protein